MAAQLTATKGPARLALSRVHLSGDELLAGAAFPLNQHGERGARDAGHEVLHGLHRGT